MRIYLKKFGTILTSRQDGKEALAAFEPTLRQIKADERIDVDFEGVSVLTPSWADEFLTELEARFGDRVTYHHTENASVKTTLEFLREIKGTVG